MDVKGLLGTIDKLYQSHKITANTLFQNHRYRYEGLVGKGSFQSLMNLMTRNNEYVQKSLHIVMSRRKIPQIQLFKNMLESSVKIEMFQFLGVLDKTLKWEILKMPSYPYLPPSHRDHHLVLDLDETLIHYDQVTETFHVRPYAEQFIVKAAKLFQITIFTAATKEYADQILDEIDPDSNISHRLYRNHLTFLQESAVKDLAMLGRDLQRTLIVDNLSNNFRMQPQNGITIRSWYGEDDDQVLQKLYKLLVKLAIQHKHDLRVGIKQNAQHINEQIAVASLIYQLKCEL